MLKNIKINYLKFSFIYFLVVAVLLYFGMFGTTFNSNNVELLFALLSFMSVPYFLVMISATAKNKKNLFSLFAVILSSLLVLMSYPIYLFSEVLLGLDGLKFNLPVLVIIGLVINSLYLFVTILKYKEDRKA